MDKLSYDKRAKITELEKETTAKVRMNYIVTRSMVFTIAVIEQLLHRCSIFCQCHHENTEISPNSLVRKGGK